MKKTIAPILLLIFSGILYSCASLYKIPKLNKIQDPQKAYIALKIESEKMHGTNTGIFITTANDCIKDKNKFYISSEKGIPYKLIEVQPGSYRLWKIRYIKEKTFYDTMYSFDLPPEAFTIFKVNPGEVVYMGDYIFGEEDKVMLEVNYDMDTCKDKLVKQNPLLEAFLWIPSIADRDSI